MSLTEEANKPATANATAAAAVSDDPEAIARRLRDKIRWQAENLLRQIDDQQEQGGGSRRGAGGSERSESPTEGTTTTHSEDGTTSSTAEHSSGAEDASSAPQSPGGGTAFSSENKAAAATATTTTATNGSATAPTSTSSSSGTELTKRLQQLAINRRQTASSSLRVIQADPSQPHLSAVRTFPELQLPRHLLDAVYGMGFDRPSQIQEAALPRILKGRNLIAQAQSGSGKTAAFALGMLYHCTDYGGDGGDDANANNNAKNPTKKAAAAATKPRVQAVCVCPTRELAIQIVEIAVQPMAAHMPGLKVGMAVAGSDFEPSSHILVGTPGKLVDWVKRGKFNTDTVKVLVLDEADHMVTGGHRANSLLLKKKMPQAQSLFFSATFTPDILKFASKIAGTADKILLAEDESLVLDVIKQIWIDTANYQGGKLEFLADIYSLLTVGQSIVFVETKQEADTIHQTLSTSGYTCSVLHGNLESRQRDETMDQFRNGRSNVLLTTNVLARGVDVDNVCLVVNYSPPVDKDKQPDFETYLHRIGRTGRFGRKGTAITLVQNPAEVECLAAIERYFSSDGSEMLQQAAADPEALADVIEI